MLWKSIVGCCLGAAGLLCAVAVADAPAPVPVPVSALLPDVHLQGWPSGRKDVLLIPEVEAFVERLLSQMSLEEKVGQMVQGDIDFIQPQDLSDYPLGSILAGGNAAPKHDVHGPAADWLALTDAFARAAKSRPARAHAAIPILFGVDAVHGNGRVRGATVFPHNVALGAAHDAEMIERIGAATAIEIEVAGIDWAFAPTVAVVRDPRWGRSYESYSEDPQLVAGYSAAMVRGLQGRLGTPSFMGGEQVAASVKHYLGDGGTIDGRDQFNNPSSAAELVRVHAAGYPPAIAAGTLTVMASYNSWQGLKMHADHALLTEVLKGRLGFNGFVVGDWNAHEEIPGCTKFDCPAAILAGIDMMMAPDSWKEVYRNTLQEVRSGVIPQSRVDAAVRRILRVKKLAGLFERPLPADRPDAGHFEKLGSPSHRELAREAVRKSLVLLKNDGGLLPLNPKAHILVAGGAADDIGQQCGGWTIDWQGDHNKNVDFPGATSIYGGIEVAVRAAGGSAELSAGGDFKQKPDAAIVVFGEQPYAEFEGDRETLEYSPGDAIDLRLLLKLRAAGVPTVAVFLSGRPLWITPHLNAATAFVAAWLPGSEGEGIADVLFRGRDGKPRYDFSGRLGFSWPRTVMPVTFTGIDEPKGALFERGYGLDYTKETSWARLPEQPGLAPGRHGAEILFAGDHVAAPWSIYLFDALASVRITTPTQVSPGKTVQVTVGSDGFIAEWDGSGNGEVQIGGKAVDLRARAAKTALRLSFEVDAAPLGKVYWGPRCNALNCGAGKAPALDVTGAFTGGVHRRAELEVPLTCFNVQDANLADVSAPFALWTDGKFKLHVRTLRYVAAQLHAACPAAAATTSTATASH